MSTALNKNITKKQLIYLIISLFLQFGFGHLCPTWSTVTPIGIQMIGVFLGWILLMVTGFGMMVPALLSFLAMLVTGYYTPSDIMVSGFGATIPIQCIFGMALIYAFRNSKGDEVAMRYLITRKFLNGHPVRFMLMFDVAIAILSVFMDIGAMLLGFALVDSIASVIGYDDKSNWKGYMQISVLVICMAISNALPAKPGALITLGTLSGALGDQMSIINTTYFTLIIVITGLILSVLIALLAKPLFRIDYSKLAALNVEVLITDENSVKMNKQQIISGIFMIIGFTFPIIQILFPADSFISEKMTGIGQIFFMAFLLGILEIIKIDGKPICNATEAFSRGVLWDVILSIISATLISGAIASESSGINEWIGIILNSVLDISNFPLMLFAVAIVGIVVTQVFSNTATNIMVSTLVVPFLVSFSNSGINATVFPAIIAQTVQMGTLTPAASAFAAMLLAQPCMQKNPKAIWKYGGGMLVLTVIISVPICILCGYIL